MKRIGLWCVVSLLMASGCTWMGSRSMQEIALVGGERLYAREKPVLRDDGFYTFYDVNGQQYVIDRSQVIYIESISVKR